MITGHENGFSVGDDRYGSRENAPIGKTAMVEDFKCPQCGDSGRIQVDLKRGICVDCAQKLENADGKCYYCGHRPSSHTDGNGNKAACSICDCTGYGKPRENADPIARCENGRAAGQERYGSVQNAKPGLRYETTCPGCRHPVKGHDDDGCGNPECSCTKPRETMED